MFICSQLSYGCIWKSRTMYCISWFLFPICLLSVICFFVDTLSPTPGDRQGLFASKAGRISTSLGEQCVCLSAAFLFSGGRQSTAVAGRPVTAVVNHQLTPWHVVSWSHNSSVPAQAAAWLAFAWARAGEGLYALCRNNFAIPHIPFATHSHKNIMNPSLFA